MFLSAIRLKNYRRLSDVTIDLDNDISIFVGSNNSGKTSVAHAMHFFVSGSKDRFSFHDISACRWGDIDAFEAGQDGSSLPVLSIDLWFEVEQADLHRVIDLLPNLDWQGAKVGVRIEFAPRNEDEALVHFRERYALAQDAVRIARTPEDNDHYVAPPRSLREFLEEEIQKEYEFKYFVLDESQFNDDLEPNAGYEPQELLREQGRTGRDIVNSLIKIDFLHAQRHLSDSEGGSRSEELSRHLSRYYQRNLKRHSEDYNALRALAESETLLNQHLEQVFTETLQRLGQLGYPGLTNPRLIIKSALNPATVMNSQDGTHVHYALNDDGLTLPDKYNGLGFKNLIYMVVELLDLHAQWLATEDKRPPLHLVFVEEPEAHLHAQLQQVFVNKVLEILAEDDEPDGFNTQLVLTTHSPHILYQRGFQPIRYFRRERTGIDQSSKVLNLSALYRTTGNPSRDFLERYLKLTHCDIFFADAAVLVEGNVERLVMPQMIEKAAPGLRSCYLSVLEIGGAYAHLFRTLIEFLGITTLVVTDLDSVSGPAEENGGVVPVEEGDVDEGEATPGSTCTPETPGAVTSNQMLAQWLPGRNRIDELLDADDEAKTKAADAFGLGAIRVTYPCTVNLERNDEQIERAGRTLEVAFAFDNLDWTQDAANRELRLRVRAPQDLEELAQKLHDKVHSSNYKKTDFALALLSKDPDSWKVPRYIAEGLMWLEATLDVTAEEVHQQEGGAV